MRFSVILRMNNFIKIRQILSLDKALFLKIKQNINSGNAASKRFWLFAESLGELRLALYAIGIINNILRDNNGNKPLFFISLKTNSAYMLAKKMLSSSRDFDNIIYFFHPAGILKKIADAYISAIRPDYFISVEHIISGHLINELLKIDAGICFLGMDPACFKKIKIGRTKGSRPILITVSNEDKKIFIEKIISFSALDKFFKVILLPESLKFNSGFDNGNDSDVKYNNGNNLVISFISVHKKEAQFILEMIKDNNLSKDYNLKFIFVPRNIKISSKLFKSVANCNLMPMYLSDIGNKDISGEFLNNSGFKSLIVDDYGSLGRIYPISDIVYVGKSLYKNERGGHNVLEPASFGRTVITGSYASNFRNVVADMIDNNAIAVITEQNFKNTLRKFINNYELRRNIGLNALKYCIERTNKSKKALTDCLSANFITTI